MNLKAVKLACAAHSVRAARMPNRLLKTAQDHRAGAQNGSVLLYSRLSQGCNQRHARYGNCSVMKLVIKIPAHRCRLTWYSLAASLHQRPPE